MHDYDSEERSVNEMAYQSPCSGFLFHNDQFGASLPPQHLRYIKSCDEDDQGLMNGDDDVSDDGSHSHLHLGEKKKRLNLEQVKTLEKSFEGGNKLEPERKVQLAKALGLQPRQVAIWFQNRRARWKTKTLERDYDLLKKQFDALKADNDTLHAHNKKLHAQLLQLKTRDSNEIGGIGIGIGIGLFKKERDEGSWSNGSDNTNTNTSDLNLAMMNSPVSSELSTKHLFNTSLIRPPTATATATTTAGMTQLLQDETLCNMFGTIEDQPGMWTWPDHHHFN